MRLFLPLLCLSISSSVFAQVCTEASFPAGGGVVNCTTLTINSDVIFTPNPTALPLEFDVTGDVIINADIIIDGADGFTLSSDNVDGAIGGPGASEGGGILGSLAQQGSDLSVNDGDRHFNNGICNNGGSGGGGVLLAGSDGMACAAGGDPAVAGGIAFGFPVIIRGGFGGGAGGAFPLGGGVFDLGSGGGGGGGIYIHTSGGTITIGNGVRISARGGRGGNAIGLGGAGGGGSGGIIWLESAIGISNKGIFDVRGGAGGINIQASSPRGGAGGAGGDGAYKLVSAGIVTDGTGFKSFASGNYKSDINCGTITKLNENSNLFMQMMAGFVLTVLLGMIIKNLFRFPKRFSRNSVHQN